jgi:tRNA pseudouridine38-40 synthase
MGADRRPAERHRTLEIDDRLDVAAMRDAAAALLGERDFAALGSNVHGRTVRRLSEVRIVQRGTLIEVRVTANAFLRRMVRSIVALLMEAGRGRLPAEAVERLLATGDRALYGRAVPAKGLTLERVRYSNTVRARESGRQAQHLRMKEQE